MRLIIHWLIFLTLMGPLVWAGLVRLQYTEFRVFMIILIVVTLFILFVFMAMEKQAPTPDGDNESSNVEEHE